MKTLSGFYAVRGRKSVASQLLMLGVAAFLISACTQPKLINELASLAALQVDPVILSISPTSGPISGGTVITIRGLNFETGAIVKIAGANCLSVSVSPPAEITCTTPTYASIAVVRVKVINPSGKFAAFHNGFAYVNNVVPLPGFGVTSGGGTVAAVAGTMSFEAQTSIGEPLDSVLTVDGTVTRYSNIQGVLADP